MKGHRYILEPYKGPSTRNRCPKCNQARQFSRYTDAVTGEPLADEVGICNRSNQCGYHYTPKQYFTDNPTASTNLAKSYKQPTYRLQTPPKKTDYLPVDLVEYSCRNYESSHLFASFKRWVGLDSARSVFKRYRVGSSTHWPGATAFWQIDRLGQARQCKIILYDPETGKRIKVGGDRVYFAGKAILKNYDANLMQCFFGEHLLKQYPQMPVAIVESEKTALFCSLFHPELIWLATGGKHGCRWTEKEVCKVLEGRTVVLFPDLKATPLWRQKAMIIAETVKCRIHVCEDLETIATDAEKDAGLDLMDYLLIQAKGIPGSQPKTNDTAKVNQDEFSYIEKKGAFLDAEKEEFSEAKKLATNKVLPKHEHWALNDLEKQLAQLAIPGGHIVLNGCSTIIDAGKFIESHLDTLRANNGNRYFKPYYSRLENLINQLNSKNSI